MFSPTTVDGSTQVTLRDSLRRELLRLAKVEDDAAAREAATVPYWAPGPASILGHRAAASVLRESADRIDTGRAAAPA